MDELLAKEIAKKINSKTNDLYSALYSARSEKGRSEAILNNLNNMKKILNKTEYDNFIDSKILDLESDIQCYNDIINIIQSKIEQDNNN